MRPKFKFSQGDLIFIPGSVLQPEIYLLVLGFAHYSYTVLHLSAHLVTSYDRDMLERECKLCDES